MRRPASLLAHGLAIAFLALGASIAQAQVQVQKLTPSDAYAGQLFGEAVAADGDWIAVGVLQDDQMGLQAGAAYMFQRSGGSFVEMQKLFASDASSSDYFGYSVALRADRCLSTILRHSISEITEQRRRVRSLCWAG